MINFRGDARTPRTSDLAAVAVPDQHLRLQPPPSGRVSRGSRRASGDHDQQHGRGQRPMPVLRAQMLARDDTEAVREVVAAQSANSTPHQERRTPDMITVTHLIRAAILILALSLAGCSGGGANDPACQRPAPTQS
jgi:hypothetical protein